MVEGFGGFGEISSSELGTILGFRVVWGFGSNPKP